jgi:hypothetical protein
MKTSARGDVTFRRDGDDLIFGWPAYKLTATLSRLRQRGDGLAGELLLAHEIAGRIHWGHLALASVSARKTLTDKLKRDIAADDEKKTTMSIPNWGALLDYLCFTAAREFRTDGEFVEAGAADDESDSEEFAVESLLLADNLNMIFAKSGVAKGYIATATALQMSTGLPVLPLKGPPEPCPTMYLDWEWTKQEFGRRLRAICRGKDYPYHTIPYRRMAGPLADQVDVVRPEIRRRGTRCLIVDSAQWAAGFGGEGDPAAAFGRLTEAIRSFGEGITTLLIDHPAKGAERGTETPYGTRYKLAACRNIWIARKWHGDQKELHVGLWHHEDSNVPPLPPVGLRLVFDRESWPAGKLRALTFHREDVRDVEGFSDLLTDAQKIERLLAAEPLKPEPIAEHIGKSVATVRTRLHEQRGKGRVVKLPDGRWALAAQRAEE